MEEKIEIKPLSEKEYQKLEEIFFEQQLYHSKLDVPYPDRFLEINIEKYIKYMKSKQLTCVFAAVINDKIIGFVSASIDKKTGYIEDIFVKEEYRNMKIGNKLFSKILKWFDENEIKKIELHVSTGNESVLEFYAKFGFKKTGYTLMRK